ncbi:protein kinase [Streptomyces sp. M2CJ-2]|uniref:serine/threonine-protein kinase n=1 Tax=Streptomyces sp. M2CJ-2 TaxID=2803948 RepID=UPI001925753C|nr:serine/threonine-protein kinase [Streptomyces sp. M2CJ-2]MBL3669314.1 protein kinase [Streptomyces sp. M2CJ-2]
MEDRFEPLRAGDPARVGPYTITARLGNGGMGTVYLARSRGGRSLAVKVIHSDLAGDQDFRRRFTREVNAARKVNGVYTAGVVDADSDGDPPWLATAYIPGPSLDAAVRRHGPWPERSVLLLAAGLAEALEAIHAAGVVHRDLKPSNVLLAADGPRVIDFGISSSSEATSALTQSGSVVGTLGFMAPEQLKGAAITPAVDVFALGMVLTFTATGTGPFGTAEGSSAAQLMYRIVYEEPDLGALPSRLRTLVGRCLAKDPAQRPTVQQLLEQLSRTDGDAQVAAGVQWLPDPLTQAVTDNAPPPPPPLPPARQPTVVDAQAPTQLAGPVAMPPGPSSGGPATPHTVPHPYGYADPRSGGARGTRRAVISAVVAATAVVMGGLAWFLPNVLGGDRDQDTPFSASEPSAATGPAQPQTEPTPSQAGSTRSAGAPAPEEPPVVGAWRGSYLCTQGKTRLGLDITSSGGGVLEAVFEFSAHPDNPDVPTGSFAMIGTYEEGRMVLRGDRWIDQPGNYLMVDLEADVPQGNPAAIEGEVVNSFGCSTFSVVRQ